MCNQENLPLDSVTHPVPHHKLGPVVTTSDFTSGNDCRFAHAVAGVYDCGWGRTVAGLGKSARRIRGRCTPSSGDRCQPPQVLDVCRRRSGCHLVVICQSVVPSFNACARVVDKVASLSRNHHGQKNKHTNGPHTEEPQSNRRKKHGDTIHQDTLMFFDI